MPRSLPVAASLLFVVANAVAQPSPLPPPSRIPQLVIDHGGPHAPINALAFAPDGTLYAGGFGKVVHRYVPRQGKYVPAGEPIRVPIGPNNAGTVNAIAISPDGKWVAVAGRAPIRGEVWSGADDGLVHQASNLSETQRQDFGVVYLFNPENPRGGKVLRGAETGVLAMVFAQRGPDDSSVLVTAGIEEDRDRKELGTLRVFDVASGKQLASRRDLPTGFPRPGLAAWGGKSLRVATAWPADPLADGNLVVWDVAANTDEKHGEGKYNIALALRTDGKSATGLVTGGIAAAGQIVERPITALAKGKPLPLGNDGKLRLPIAVAPVGADCAVLCFLPQPKGAADLPAELLIVSAAGKTLGLVKLEGIGAGTLPTLAASRDGCTLAVAGFADDRIEIHDAAKVTASERTPQTLAAAPRGHARVAFLAGNRLWLGKANETAPAGGTVLDFNTRKAAAGAGDDKIDGPPRGGRVPFESVPIAESKAVSVEVEIQGVKKRFALPEGEEPTAAALLPAGPAWDLKQGSVLAVAHYHGKAAKSLITLFDAATQRPLLELSGPALAVEGLAFSNTRPLIAAVGPDPVLSVWSLRSLAEPFSAIEGLTLEEQNGTLVVASLADDSPSKDLLKKGDIVAAVELKPVRTYHEFLRTVRAIPIGKTARIQVKGAAAPVVVPVGRGLGHRHSLFDLWVNPVANDDATHDWIGWTPAGPYDTNSPQAESRLGWLTATGDPAAPTVYAGADQYRRQYYKPNFLRFLGAEGDFGAAIKRYTAENPRTPPTLSLHADGLEERDGRNVFRTRPAKLEVRLDDPDQSIPRDRALLRWRTLDSNGAAGAWREVPFTTGRASIEPPDDTWRRGMHRFEAAVHEGPDLPASLTSTLALHFVPTAPVLAIRANGEKIESGMDLSTDKDEIEIAADVQAAPGEKGEVWWTATVADGKTPREMAGKPDGRFGPASVRLNADEKTVIRFTALNVGSGKEPMESASAEITVWRTPKPREVPRLRLSLASAADPPAALGKPHVSDARKVVLSAAINAEKFEKLEWDHGDGKWIDAEFKPKDPTNALATREVTLAAGGKPIVLRARVTAGGSSRIDLLNVVWAGLPEAEIAILPPSTTKANLVVHGKAKPVADGAAFTLQLVVDSPDSLRPPRTYGVMSGADNSWSGEVEVVPGVNRIGLLVGNEWKQVRITPREVRYLRPPQVVAAKPIAAKGANVGDVVAVVVTPDGLPPDRLILESRSLEAKREGPMRLFGAAVWRLRVESVPLEIGGALPKSVRLAARNAEGEGPSIEVEVIPKPVEAPPPPPPEIAVLTIPVGTAIPHRASIRTDQPRYELRLEIASVAKLVRIDALHSREGGQQSTRIPGVSVDAAKPTPSGFALIVSPDVALHEGVNSFEIEAATDRGSAKFEFSVSYTPPPVRVTVDSIQELVSGTVHALSNGGPLNVGEGIVQVRGRIVWTAAAAAKGLGFEVVLVANEVRHPSVVLVAPNGKFESEFTAKLFLNAKEVAVRVEVDRFGAAAAREKVSGTGLVIRTLKPIEQQRLHVIVIAPNASEEKAKRAELAREVITAIGGEYPPSDPVGDRGQFKHATFPAGATFYPPLVSGINPSHIRSRMVLVKDRISQMAAEPQGWVNDVVLVYYRGRDECDAKDGRLMIATCEEPLRVDELPATPGVRLLILNAVNESGDTRPTDPVRTGLNYLRYVWRNSKDADGLPDLYRLAVREKVRVGEVVDRVGDQVKTGTSAGALPNPVRERTLGVPVSK